MEGNGGEWRQMEARRGYLMCDLGELSHDALEEELERLERRVEELMQA